MKTDKKQCPYCNHGRQTSPSAPRPYPCEDCKGTGELYWCEYCEKWLDPGVFNDPDTPLCARCEENGDHLRYWSEAMSVFDRDTGGDCVIIAGMTQAAPNGSEAHKQACQLAAKIAELLNDAEE